MINQELIEELEKYHMTKEVIVRVNLGIEKEIKKIVYDEDTEKVVIILK